MIFDCPNRKECEEMGVLVDSECIAYCGLYETHRVKLLEQVTWEMFQYIESAYVSGNFSPRAYAEYRDRLEALGIETYGFKTEEDDD